MPKVLYSRVYLINMKTVIVPIKTSWQSKGVLAGRIIWLMVLMSVVLMIRPTPLVAETEFSAEIKTLPSWVISRMKRYSWRKKCPVPLEQLSYIYLKHWDYEGKIQFGRLVVHQKVAEDIVGIFKILFEAKFPIATMKLIDDYQGSDAESMSANNTSAFNCRFVTGKKGVFSKHSSGTAIDINPLVNPYVKQGMIAPLQGKHYLDRGASFQGMIKKEDMVYKAFKKRGWIWGGDWQTIKDYQHFQKTIND